MMSEIKRAHTSCQDCVFAKYFVDSNTQIDCQFNLIDKYRDNEQLLEAYNENGEFYIVNGRLCYYKRTKEWLNRQDLSKSSLNIVMKEQMVPYVCFIGVRPNQNIEDIKTTLDSAQKQTYAPSLYNLLLLAPCNPNFVHSVISLCVSQDIHWTVTKLQDVGTTFDRAILDFVSLHAKKYTIYQFSEAGLVIQPDFIFKLNARIIEEDFRFTKLMRKGWTIGNSMAHKYFRQSFHNYGKEYNE